MYLTWSPACSCAVRYLQSNDRGAGGRITSGLSLSPSTQSAHSTTRTPSMPAASCSIVRSTRLCATASRVADRAQWPLSHAVGSSLPVMPPLIVAPPDLLMRTARDFIRLLVVAVRPQFRQNEAVSSAAVDFDVPLPDFLAQGLSAAHWTIRFHHHIGCSTRPSTRVRISRRSNGL